MKSFLRAATLWALASQVAGQVPSSSLSSTAAAAASSSAAALLSSSDLPSVVPSLSAVVGSSGAAVASSGAVVASSGAVAASSGAAAGSSGAVAASSAAGGGSGASSAAAAPSPSPSPKLPALPLGFTFAFASNGFVFVIIIFQFPAKRDLAERQAQSIQQCIDSCATAPAGQCASAQYNTATGACTFTTNQCQPPAPGTAQAVLVGTSSNNVQVPTCILQPGFAGSGLSVSALVSGSVTASVSRPASSGASMASMASGASLTGSATAGAASPSGSAVIGIAPVCPQDNGRTFTVNGVAFTVICGTGTVGKLRRSIESENGLAKRQATTANAFGICITSCANTPGCQSLLFNPVNGACALYDCVVTVPAGLSGAVRVGGSPICPPTTPTNIPVNNVPSNNVNVNVNVNVNLNLTVNLPGVQGVLTGTYQGLPYTQICCVASCTPCAVCTPVPPAPSCSVCQVPGVPPPMTPSQSWVPPGVPGYPNYPGTCGSNCPAPPAPPGPAPPAPPAPPSGGSSSSPPSSPGAPASPNAPGVPGAPASPNGGGTTTSPKYTGPMSNDAAGFSAAFGSLAGGVAAFAFAFA